MSEIEILQQICNEDLYNKNQQKEIVLKDLKSGLSEQIEKAEIVLYEYFDKTYSYESKNTRLNEYINKNGFNMKSLLEELLVIILPNDFDMKIQGVVGKLAKFLDYENQWDGVKTAAEIVVVIGKLEDSLYDIIPAKNSEFGSITISPNFVLEEETLQILSDFKYLPPMTTKPPKIFNNFQSAYLTRNESIILGKGNHHNEHLALDAVNIANKVELSLDEWVMTLKEESKKPLNIQQVKRNGELETITEMQQRAKGHNRMALSSKKVYTDLVELGNKFYLTWKYDKRGRIYCSGYHVSIQASEYKKALINLANKQTIRLT